MCARWLHCQHYALWLLLVGVFHSGNVPVAHAVVVEGQLPREANFTHFVTKFCYDYLSTMERAVGKITIDLRRLGDETTRGRPVPDEGKLKFLIFDDEKQHWKRVRERWDTSSCEEKELAASDVLNVQVEAGKETNNYEVQIKEHLRPRFWYFAFVACNMRSSEPVRYKVHMKNDTWGWQSEFSLDHMGLFALYATFAAAFALTTAVTSCASRRRRSPSDPPLRDHPFLQLLLLSYWASLSSCVLFLAHYSLFVRDGCGSKRIRFLAVVASIVANCTIFLIAILSSNGWAITNFSMPNRRCFLTMILLVGGIGALSELHSQTAVDQSTALYSYQSGPGVLTLIIKIFIFCWFAFQIKSSYEEELQQSLRRFYKYLGISIAFWALNVPVTVLLAFKLSPWVRYKIVITVEVVARFLGQLLLSQLLCGPLSPITAENTFSPALLEAPFGQLDDGKGPG